jgi:CRP-like cAMP-binding protein
MIAFQPSFVAPANGFLAALSSQEFKRLVPHLEETRFTRGHVLFSPGQTVEHAYFLDDGLVSLSLPQHGAAVGLAMAGHETVIGSNNIVNNKPAQQQATVQVEGTGWTVPSFVFKREFARGGRLQELVVEELLSQHQHVTQQALCYASHTPQERLGSRLLEIRERIGGGIPEISSEFLHQLAGGDGAMQNAIEELERAGAIRLHNGYWQLGDDGQIEDCACTCYANTLLRQARFSMMQNRYEHARIAFEDAQTRFSSRPRACKNRKARKRSQLSA